jgi:hypothetical protein
VNARRISDIVKALAKARQMGAKLKGCSALERELQDWIISPTIECKCDWEPRQAQPTPMPYEFEMGLTL